MKSLSEVREWLRCVTRFSPISGVLAAPLFFGKRL